MSGGNANESSDFAPHARASRSAALQSRTAGSKDESPGEAIHQSTLLTSSGADGSTIRGCATEFREGLRCASASVPVRFLAHVVCRDFMDDPGNGCEVCSDVMLETVFANVAQQFLHVGNLDDSGAAECFQRIIGESPFADVAADHAILIVGR